MRHISLFRRARLRWLELLSPWLRPPGEEPRPLGGVVRHEMLLDHELSEVGEMSARAGLGQRTLERVCRQAFGFPPKLLLRRQRFMRSLARFMMDPSLGWIGAMDSLYFDQSQFVRDCHTFLGMAPSEYAAMEHPILAAFMRERQRTHGSAVQTLDKPG